MIFKLLDAYEEVIKNEYSFMKKIKRMSVINKICFGYLCINFAVILGTLFLVKDAVLQYVINLICAIVALAFIGLVERERQKNYIRNMREYNERLDKLKELIEREEFGIRTEDRLINLINKVKKYIDSENVKKNEMKNEDKQFCSNIIIPIVAFAFGYWYSDMPAYVTLQECTVLVVIIFFARYIYYKILMLKEEVMESLEKKMLYLLNELQDLYDRDYIQ